MPGVYMQTVIWNIGQIYVNNNYSDVSFLGFHNVVIIASNMMLITFFNLTLRVVNIGYVHPINGHYPISIIADLGFFCPWLL